MFRFDGTRFALDPSASEVINHYANLTSDLRSLAGGACPSEATLASAPLLDCYCFLLLPTVVCMGPVYGHPNSRTNPSVMHTSEVIVDGRDLGWLRTRSRYYRVGQQLPSPDEVAAYYFDNRNRD